MILSFRSIMSILFLLLAANVVQGADCSDKDWIEKNWTEKFDEISAKEVIDTDDLERLLSPLKKGFVTNFGSCGDLVGNLTDRALSILSAHQEEVTGELFNICSQNLPETRDLSILAGLNEEKAAAKDALIGLGVSVDGDVFNPNAPECH